MPRAGSSQAVKAGIRSASGDARRADAALHLTAACRLRSQVRDSDGLEVVGRSEQVGVYSHDDPTLPTRSPSLAAAVRTLGPLARVLAAVAPHLRAPVKRRSDGPMACHGASCAASARPPSCVRQLRGGPGPRRAPTPTPCQGSDSAALGRARRLGVYTRARAAGMGRPA